MKKITFKTMMVIVLFCAMAANGMAVCVSAETGISPRYTNCSYCDVMFDISSTGIASTDATYMGHETFTQAKMSVKVQKKTMFFFWATVDIGTPDDIWVVYCYDRVGELVYDLQLYDKGTFRAVITIEFMGTTGVVDTIERTLEATYS